MPDVQNTSSSMIESIVVICWENNIVFSDIAI